MKKIIKKVAYIFQWLFNRKEAKIDNINEHLEKALKKEVNARIKLKLEIKRFVRKNYGIRLSKYIPRKQHNPAEIYSSVQLTYGKKMKELSLVLNRNLTWKR